jgi:microcystin-dependent protein
MPADTTCRDYPYPVDGDPIDVAGDIKRLADAVDADVCAIAGQLGAGVPIGTLLISALVTEPIGFVFCRGQALDRTTYAALFAAIGTRYGAGNGTSTFNVPNMQATLPVGFNTNVNPPAGVTTAFSTALGERGGSTNATLPSHQHAGTDHLHGINQFTGPENAAHSHNINMGEVYRYNPFVPVGYHAGGSPGDGSPFDILNTNGLATAGENQNHVHAMNAATDAADRNLATGFTGVSPNGANYPPCQSFNYIIKAVSG